MKITSLKYGRKGDRVNVFIDGKFRFSLDVSQVLDLGIKVGYDCIDSDITRFENESKFGKVYQNSVDYCLMRPRSAREVKNYLWRKEKLSMIGDSDSCQEIIKDINVRVLEKLIHNKYIDDEKFAIYWSENRSLKKGISKRKMSQELMQKGIDVTTIDSVIGGSDRNDIDELKKIISKKSKRYSDKKKLASYLMRLGFNYYDINQALSEVD